MMLPTYSPVDRQIDRLFAEAVGALARQGRRWSPAWNAWEDEEHFCLEAGLPGWQAGDVDIQIEEGVVTVTGKKQEVPEKTRTYYTQEFGNADFARSFTLPHHVNADQARASFKEGVLTILFPKDEGAKPRRIAIQ